MLDKRQPSGVHGSVVLSSKQQNQIPATLVEISSCFSMFVRDLGIYMDTDATIWAHITATV